MSSTRVVMLGEGGVGKSALTLRLISDAFVDEHDPTIEDSYRTHELVDDESVLLEVLDTAGQEEYEMMQEQWIASGDGFLIVFAINDKATFEKADAIKERVDRIKEPIGDEAGGAQDRRPAVILVGSKCDLADSSRQVPEDQARAKAKRWGCLYVECSAKEKINEKEPFYEVVRELRRRTVAEQKTSGGGGGGSGGQRGSKGTRRKGLRCMLL